MMKYFVIMILSLSVLSCMDVRQNELENLLEKWINREVKFPATSIFTVQGKDTVGFYVGGEYKIVTYVDTIGCTSCKLQLSDWKKFMNVVDSIKGDSVKFLYYFAPKKNREVYSVLRTEKFVYPVCIDEKDSLNILNQFPSKMEYQTFLLDRDNKIIAIGNPIHNSKVKDLYLKIIRGEELTQMNEDTGLVTEVGIDSTFLSLGNFGWEKEQKVVFTLKNTGDNTLVIDAVATSCGCTKVEYDKEPVCPGGSVDLHVSYKAEHPEHFNKTITVYCNAKVSPLLLKIMGNAE